MTRMDDQGNIGRKPQSTLTFVEIRIRVAKASALGKALYGIRVDAHIVERAILYHEPDGLVGRQTFGSTKAMVFRLHHARAVTLFATSVVIDPIFRTVTNVRARVIRRYDVKLGTRVPTSHYLSFTSKKSINLYAQKLPLKFAKKICI